MAGGGENPRIPPIQHANAQGAAAGAPTQGQGGDKAIEPGADNDDVNILAGLVIMTCLLFQNLVQDRLLSGGILRCENMPYQIFRNFIGNDARGNAKFCPDSGPGLAQNRLIIFSSHS